MCHRELQRDGTLSERSVTPTFALAAISPLLALRNDELSLHGARCLTTGPLAPLYPESGLLLESTCVDFTGAGSTASALGSSAATGQGPVSVGTGSGGAAAVTGTDCITLG